MLSACQKESKQQHRVHETNKVSKGVVQRIQAQARHRPTCDASMHETAQLLQHTGSHGLASWTCAHRRLEAGWLLARPVALTAGLVAAPSVCWFLACTATTGLLLLLLVVAATRGAGLHLQSNHVCTHQKWFKHQLGLINMGRRKQPATVAAGKLLQPPAPGFCVIGNCVLCHWFCVIGNWVVSHLCVLLLLDNTARSS